MAERIGSLEPADIAEAVSAIKDQVVHLVNEANERLEIERRMQENPWLVLGIAAGAGFILGGGLWTAVRPFAKAVGRTAFSPSNLLAVAAALGAMRATGAGRDAASERETTAPTTPTAH